MSFKKRLAVYVEMTRPFTLLAPAVGFLAGGVVAVGSLETLKPSWSVFGHMLLGAIAAALLNAASNIVNQIFDLEIDAVNKPTRPLPSDRIGELAAWVEALVLFALSAGLAYLVGTQFFVILLITAFVVYAYSGPPFRTKRFGIWANVTIAIPRGLLLLVAGWASVAPVSYLEPWYVGLIFGLFVLGAATTKDFSDMKGDAAHGCRTLPIIYGVEKAALMTAPAYVAPWFLLPVGVTLGILHGNGIVLTLLCLALAGWGVYINYLILRKPEALATEANHVSWKHMYLMLLAAQIGVAVAYLF